MIKVKTIYKVIPGLYEFHSFTLFHKLENIASSMSRVNCFVQNGAPLSKTVCGKQKKKKYFEPQ